MNVRLRAAGREPVALGLLVLAALALPSLTGKPAPAGVFALGLVAAASMAAHGIGLTLVYRADRCINLAQVQMGAAAAVLFSMLVQGQPLLRAVEATCPPCVGEPGSGLLAANYVVAIALSLSAAAGVGWLFHATVVRRLRSAPPVVLTVATAFALQLLAGVQSRLPDLLSTEEQRRLGQIGGVVKPPVDIAVDAGGVVLHLPQLLLLGWAAAAVGLVGVWLRRTAAGRDLRATASDRDRAATLGIDPDRAARRAWALAGLLSGGVGILGAAAIGVGTAGEGAVAVSGLVRILVVVAVARFVDLRLVALGSLAFGLLQESVTWSWGTANALDATTVLLVGGLLLLARRARAGGDRDDAPWRAVRTPPAMPAALRDLPEVLRARRAVLAVTAVMALVLPWLLSPAQAGLAAVAAVLAVVGLSTLVVTGWGGQVTLGQLALAAVGAAVAGITHAPLPIAVILAAVVCGAVAALAGGPALRLPGLQLAVVTLALSLSVSASILNPGSIGSAVGRVGGDGIPGLDVSDPRAGWYVALLFAAGSAVLVARFRSSRPGRALIAARDDEASAQSFAVDVVRARLAAFAVAGALAGAAGAVLAHLQGNVAPETFTPEQGLVVFTTTVLGGLGSVAGPLLGFALAGLLSVGAVPGAVVSLLAGAGGLVLLLIAPGGLVEVFVAARTALLRRVARRRRIEVPGLTVAGPAGRLPIAGPAPVPAGRYRLEGQWALARHPEPVPGGGDD